MGSDLRAMPKGAKAPGFMVYALRDPIGANLDRIQIVKGWVDASGKTQEKVYDVAWSDKRMPGADGKLPPGGQHRRRRQRQLDQHHRCRRAGDNLDRSRIRPGAEGLLLCAGA